MRRWVSRRPDARLAGPDPLHPGGRGDNARCGLVVGSGPLVNNGEAVAHSLEPMLRKLGLPTVLKNGPWRPALASPAHPCVRAAAAHPTGGLAIAASAATASRRCEPDHPVPGVHGWRATQGGGCACFGTKAALVFPATEGGGADRSRRASPRFVHATCGASGPVRHRNCSTFSWPSSTLRCCVSGTRPSSPTLFRPPCREQIQGPDQRLGRETCRREACGWTGEGREVARY